jgi:nitrogen fixation/metabolism regulation signal transduction histidine kinase
MHTHKIICRVSQWCYDSKTRIINLKEDANIIYRTVTEPSEKGILSSHTFTMTMRGRIASFAIGSAIARRRTGAAMAQAQDQQAQAQAQQQEIEQLKAAQAQQTQQSSNQEDITQKLEKLAELHQKGLLTDEEFQKLKMNLISKL